MWMVCRHFCFYKPSKTIHSKFKKAYEQIEGLQETAEYVDRITQTWVATCTGRMIGASRKMYYVIYYIVSQENSTLDYPQSQIYLALSWKGGGRSGNTCQSSKNPEKKTGYAAVCYSCKFSEACWIKGAYFWNTVKFKYSLNILKFDTQSMNSIEQLLNSCLLAKWSNIGHSASISSSKTDSKSVCFSFDIFSCRFTGLDQKTTNAWTTQ